MPADFIQKRLLRTVRTIAQPTASVNSVSDALQAANARLHALRKAVPDREVELRPNLQSISMAVLEQRRHACGVGQRPTTPALPLLTIIPAADPVCTPDALVELSNADAALRMYPDLLLGMLRSEQVAIGRIWLLCRHLDTAGRGWLDLASVREQLTRKNGPLRVVGKRRLRQILTAGEGRFWERDECGRLWLYGVARVAAKLKVERLTNRPIALSIAALVASLAQARAHCYAAFHSGRRIDADSQLGAPISRATMTQFSGITERTQRRYDTLAGVETRSCVAIGAVYNSADHAESVWQHGGGTFKFTDYRGLHGRAGTTYSAWQLPNQYRGCHARLPNGRQRKLNRQLQQLANNHHTDLVRQRAQGNGMGTEAEAGCQAEFKRVFFTSGKAAVAAKAAAMSDATYCLDRATRTTSLWITLG